MDECCKATLEGAADEVAGFAAWGTVFTAPQVAAWLRARAAGDQ